MTGFANFIGFIWNLFCWLPVGWQLVWQLLLIVFIGWSLIRLVGAILDAIPFL